MRGRSFDTRPDRCPRCALVKAVCLCAELPRVETRTRVVIVRHVRELRKPSGTARIAALALPSAKIIDYRDETGPLPAGVRNVHVALSPADVGARIATLPAPHLLFPTGRSASAPPATLVILDGTWRQARAMYQRIPGCAALPTLSLDAPPSATRRLRSPIRPHERSTLEAIADALTALEGEVIAAPLYALHARFVEQSLRTRGRTP